MYVANQWFKRDHRPSACIKPPQTPNFALFPPRKRIVGVLGLGFYWTDSVLCVPSPAELVEQYLHCCESSPRNVPRLRPGCESASASEYSEISQLLHHHCFRRIEDACKLALVECETSVKGESCIAMDRCPTSLVEGQGRRKG
jgi:hypothetical protein